MDAVVDIPRSTIKTKTESPTVLNAEIVTAADKKNKRGRPKGARTTRLSEVRQQAAEEKKKIRAELSAKITALQADLQALQQRYEQDTHQLSDELELLRRRESSYQQVLSVRLNEVAEHLQSTLIKWGTAELKEAQIDKRGRGRPRKTLK